MAATDPQRPILTHLEEMRWRLLIIVLTVVIATVACLVFFSQVIGVLLQPSQGLLSSTGVGKPVFTEVTEIVGVVVRVALLGGFVLALPVVLYQVIMFARPGLKPGERRLLFGVLPGALACFGLGATFAFYVLLPPILRFLLTFGQDVATPMIRIGNYVNVVITMLFWMGLVFQTPLVMFVLAKAGVVSPATMARGRRYIVVLAFVLGAMITPTFDPLNQTLTAGPLIVLYEVGIWLSKLAQWQRKPLRLRRRGGAAADR